MSESSFPPWTIPVDVGRSSRWASGLPLAVALGLLAALAGASSSATIATLYVAAATPELVFADRELHRLPNRLVLPGYPVAAVALLLAALADGSDARLPVAAGACYFVFMLLLALAGGVGFGDVKLAGLLGICLGTLDVGAALAGPVLAFLFGGAQAASSILARGAGRAARIPFGPSMLLGFWTAVAGATVFSGVG